MLTVTNTFENKTAAAMAAISPNLITAEPSVDGIAAGLLEASRGRRRRRAAAARAATFNGAATGSDSFDDEVVDRVSSFLEAR